ncbi:hypothetical protein OTU49_013237, partial [Cherax quadricarinatus]
GEHAATTDGTLVRAYQEQGPALLQGVVSSQPSEMKQIGLLVMLLVFTPRCYGQAWEQLAVAVAEKLIDLWQLGEFQLLGHKCNYSVTPKIRRLELYFQGSMWCPGWTLIRGEALTRSRSGVIGDTTQDFVRKAFIAGLITEQEAQAWLTT